MKAVVLALGLAATLAASAQGQPAMCDISPTPSATLLLPYFEVDLGDPQGVTTLFSVNNASATAIIAHVTVWTDLSVPVFDFDIYLTGFDVQTLNLRDALVVGNLPVTASDGQDPFDTISPQGPISQDINFASCNGTLPYSSPVLEAGMRGHVQAWLTGNASPLTGNCAGRNHGDNVARGYITVDTASQCSLEFPGDPGYFSPGGAGVATNQNVLWGDWFLVDPGSDFSQGDTLVHIQARSDFFGGPTGYTFYSRFNTFGADNREPLSTTWATRQILGGAFTGGTDLVVWRDATVPVGPFACGTTPPPFPLNQNQIVIFDEQEQVVTASGGGVSGEPDITLFPFPWETQRVTVGGPDLPIPPGFEFGWLFLNLNTTVAGSNTPPGISQSWVTSIYSAEGRHSAGLQAIPLASACEPTNLILPVF